MDELCYEHTCPYWAEWSAVFVQKQHNPCAPPLYSPDLALSDFFVSQMKKVLKGKSFAHVEEVKQKMAKEWKLMNSKTEHWKKILIGVLHQGKYFEGDWSLNM